MLALNGGAAQGGFAQDTGEGGLTGYRPWHPGEGDAVDAAVLATRKAVFPLHGLDPWFD